MEAPLVTMMTPSRCSAVTILLLIGFIGHVTAGGLRKSANVTRNLVNSQLCNIQKVDGHFEDGRSDEKTKCLVDGDWNGYTNGVDDFAYDITLPTSFLAQNDQAIRSGSFYIAIPNGEIVDDGVHPPYVTVPDASAISVVNGLGRRNRRQLQTRANSVLVVRVSTTRGDRCDPTRNALAGSVFGLGSEALPHSMRSQYEACSNGQQSFRPVSGNGVVNGVVDVTIDIDIRGREMFSISNAMNRAAINAVGDSLSESPRHVMYCVPPGTVFDGMTNWVAFAYINGVSSYYNNYWCDRLSSQVHEIGHNLGMDHSNENGGEYGDQSGMMGFSYPQRNGPLMCFNAFKHYKFGWFSRQTRTITGEWTGQLAAFVDAELDTSKDVILKMNDVYIQLNRRKGENAGTFEKADKVVLVQGSEGQGKSNVLAGLGAGDTYNVGGRTVEVCDVNFRGTIDFAQVSIYYVGRQSGCTSTKGIAYDSCEDDPVASFVVNGSFRQCSWVRSWASIYNSRGTYYDNYNKFCSGLATYYCKASCRKC